MCIGIRVPFNLSEVEAPTRVRGTTIGQTLPIHWDKDSYSSLPLNDPSKNLSKSVGCPLCVFSTREKKRSYNYPGQSCGP